MADHIIGMRMALKENLEKLGSPLSWEHITNQVKTTLNIVVDIIYLDSVTCVFLQFLRVSSMLLEVVSVVS